MINRCCTCYINSAVQALFFCQPITSFLVRLDRNDVIVRQQGNEYVNSFYIEQIVESKITQKS